MTLDRVTGLFLIALPLAFNITFFALGRAFEYPDILRQPAETILQKFAAGGRQLVGLWYAFALTALLAIPVAFLFGQVFAAQQPALANVSIILGVLSGLVQALGLFRWTFLVPSLAVSYATAAPAAREAITVVFHAFHQYVGVAVGEHLGYFFTAAWTIILSVMMFNSALFSPLLGMFGIVAAVGIMAGLLEPAGWKPAGAVNAISYVLWSLWLILAGITLIFASRILV